MGRNNVFVGKKEDPPWFHPSINDIIIHPDMFTKLSLGMLGKIRVSIVNNNLHTRPHGIKKWEEIVTVESQRYAVECHPDGEGKIVVTGARVAHKSKK
jgi:hypothetical protein